MTNRELYFFFQNERDEEITDKDIIEILLYVNDFNSYTDLILFFDNECKDENKAKEIFKRILNGEFLAYIINKTNFKDIDIYVDKSTLIPRIETSELIDKSIKYIKELNIKHDKIADICTGSGIIALFLKKEFNDSIVYASDIHEDTLNVAKKNFSDNNLKIETFIGDKTEPFLKNNIKLDVLISNPPYVKNMDDIDEKVKNNEPLDAIYTPKGYEFYEDFFKNAENLMNDKFFMAFEMNYDQENELTILIEKYLKNVYYKFEKDFYGLPRMLFISKGYEL